VTKHTAFSANFTIFGPADYRFEVSSRMNTPFVLMMSVWKQENGTVIKRCHGDTMCLLTEEAKHVVSVCECNAEVH
jgi:hypothetical protein